MQKVILFGNGQLACLNYMYLKHYSQYNVIAFTVDQGYLKEDKLFGLPVVPFENIQDIYSPEDFKLFIVMSYKKRNRPRAEKYFQAKEKGYELITYISPKAFIWPEHAIGENCFIQANIIIDPFCEIGNNVFMGPGTLVGHNAVIKDHCFIGPNSTILGATTIEPFCFIGANSTIKDGITIARNCVIGAGVAITENTQEGSVYINRSAELLQPNKDRS